MIRGVTEPWFTVLKRLIFFAILALPFFVVLDKSSVWDANEAFYVQTPREMLERGDWLVPYFNGVPRLNKPPLSYWLVGACYRFFGVSLSWERLILALLGFGSVLLVHRIGKLLFDAETALLAAGIFATTFRLLMLSRRLLIDVLLLFCLLAMLLFFLDWFKRNRRGSLSLAAVFLGLAFLAKGPVSLIGPLLLYLSLIRGGQRRRLKVRVLVLPTLVFLVIASSWFMLLFLRLGWDPIITFFFRENLGRFANIDYGPVRGWYYYIGVFLGDFFPWSLFFIAALVNRIIELRRESDSGASTRREPHSALLYWCIGYVVLFSASLNKQEYYILPAYPAAALWLAHQTRRHAPPRWLFRPLALVILAAIVAVYLFAAHTLRPGLLWLPLLVAPLVAGALALRRLDWTAAALAVFYALAFACYLPPFEAYKPVPGFAQKIKEQTKSLVAEGEQVEVGYYNFAAPSLVFYLNRPIFESYSLTDAVARMRSSKMVFMIVRGEDYNALCEASGSALQIVDSRPKIYTTARFFVEGLKSDGYQIDRSTRAVYLVSNKGLRHSPVVGRNPGF